MDLHAKQNEMNRKEAILKRRKGGVLDFFGEPDIKDMDERFIVVYDEYKKKLDVLRKQVDKLEKEVEVQEEKKVNASNTKIKELSQEIATLNEVISFKRKIVDDLKTEITIIRSSIINSKNIYEDKLIEVETRDKEASIKLAQSAEKCNETKVLKKANEVILKQIDAEIINLDANKKDSEQKSQSFQKVVNVKNKELDNRILCVEAKEQKSGEVLEQAEKYLAIAKNKEDEVKIILYRLEEVEKREVASTEKEAVNQKRTEENNETTVKNKVDAKSNSQRNEALDEKEKKIDVRDKNVKTLESNLASKL